MINYCGSSGEGGGIGGWDVMRERENDEERERDDGVKKWENEKWNEMIWEWEKMKEMGVMMKKKDEKERRWGGRIKGGM